MSPRTIWLRTDAPPKPRPGAPCNGCGVCCAAEPCPLGMLASGRRSGRCRMLRFDSQSGRYRCGLLSAGMRAVKPLARLLPRWLVARWIAAGRGCDSTVEVGHAELANQTRAARARATTEG